MSLEIHIDWQGQTQFAGILHISERGQAVSFQYAEEWLARPDAFALDPTSLPIGRGIFHSPSLFGALQDCGPDRWGRLLVERAVRKKLLDQRPYRDIDFVVALDDSSRIGALRFRSSEDGPFLAPSTGKLPPLVQLAALLRATDAVHGDSETAKDLRFLLGQGSPLGGARPKSAVALPDGSQGIAKFPKPDDTCDIAAGEILALTLAEEAGMTIPAHRLIRVGQQSVAVIKRFDRRGTQRIPFISAASLVGIPASEGGSYTMIADAIRQVGDDIAKDLRELWRRMVFALLASNYDDHLRNHGFLMHTPGRWSLAPAYDLNPVPEMERARMNKTSITEDLEEPNIAGALASAARFGLSPEQARQVLADVFNAVSGWRKTVRRLRLPASTISAYESAFEHPLLEEAAQWIQNLTSARR